MAETSAKTAVLDVRGTRKEIVTGTAKQFEALNGLSIRESIFVREYINNGGNATRAVLKASPRLTYGAAGTTAWQELRKPHVRAALSEILTVTATADYVKAKFQRLSQDDKDDNIQLKATRELGHVLGLYGGEGMGTQNNLQINVNIPGIARDPVIEVNGQETGE